MAKTELGEVLILGNQQFFSLANLIFSDFARLDVFRPLPAAMDFRTRNAFIVWATQKEEQRIPTLEECRDEIIAFWKWQKAYEAAVVDAEKIAKEVNAEKVSLVEKFKERAIDVGQFSWYSALSNRRISQPTGVENAGTEFMEKAFTLQKGEAGAAPNFTMEIVYVIRITEKDERTEEQLNKDFLEQVARVQMVPMDIQNVAEDYAQEMFVDRSNNFIEDMEVKWSGQ
jgi:hypothetical protein